MTSKKELLLLSSSRVGSTDYLAHALPMIKSHLADIDTVLFIPYAGVTINNDQYTQMVENALSSINVAVEGIHQYDDQVNAIETAQAIIIGGGNTFRLLEQLYNHDLIRTIKAKVEQGTPYIGWSAGSNVAGLSIKTTNDMPIVEPKSFNALALVNFQINPHYTDYTPPNHNGETREQRLQEFMVLSPDTLIVGIVEGTALQYKNSTITLLGNSKDSNGYIFKAGNKRTIKIGDTIQST
ncbi:dipeptidase PepE [Thalassotalea profundi]|uniref:Peptidase E n=1 Tax=Thalassotalea profundi TaxID=2036687 RepID=A0ABQ3IFL5_9GAMM|nr:dipeptidase PepE [Thalassotalea profundi]GHE82759.1 peptidase E [Thalassotalea profundi]